MIAVATIKLILALMLTVVIPTLNAAMSLPETLLSLRDEAQKGLVDDVIVVDGGSNDETVDVARNLDARVVASERGRGQQLAGGTGKTE